MFCWRHDGRVTTREPLAGSSLSYTPNIFQIFSNVLANITLWRFLVNMHLYLVTCCFAPQIPPLPWQSQVFPRNFQVAKKSSSRFASVSPRKRALDDVVVDQGRFNTEKLMKLHQEQGCCWLFFLPSIVCTHPIVHPFYILDELHELWMWLSQSKTNYTTGLNHKSHSMLWYENFSEATFALSFSIPVLFFAVALKRHPLGSLEKVISFWFFCLQGPLAQM